MAKIWTRQHSVHSSIRGHQGCISVSQLCRIRVTIYMKNQTSPNNNSPERTARMLVDNLVREHIHDINSSSSGIFSAQGRGVIAAVALSTSALFAGLMATSTTGTFVFIAGTASVLSGLIGIHSAVTAYVLRKSESDLNDFKKLECMLLSTPRIQEELTKEVIKEMNEEDQANVTEALFNVGKKNGLFLNNTRDSSWVNRCQSDLRQDESMNRK